MLNIMPPPAMQGDEQAQLSQVYRYLFRLSEQLNVALSDTDKQIQQVRTLKPVTKTTVINKVVSGGDGGGEEGGVTEEELMKQYNELKALIEKTADDVRNEMDVIISQLDSKYVAESEWGTYKEEVSREIVDTAKYTIENYEYDSEILNIPEMATDFAAYKLEAQGYIKRGIIGYDEGGLPILGIAIGQELASKKVTIDGVEYEEFDKTVNMATYTADKLSFWINGVEVAYMSNSELDVTRIIVSDSIKLGGWDINVNAKDDLTIQKELGRALVKAEIIDLVISEVNVEANEALRLAIGTDQNVRRWFGFNDEGLIIRKPGSIWYTKTDENGYHIHNDQQTEPVGSFQYGGLKTTGVQIGDIITKRTSLGGWVWTDAT